ncbi:hypothetical protein D3C86_1434890 [compost metagenome]
MTERFAAMHVRQMYFHERDRHAGQGIAQRHAGVRIGRRVDEDEVHPLAACRLDTIHQRPFMVGLERIKIQASRGGAFCQRIVDIGERRVPVRLRLARAQQIEVRSMQDQHLPVACSAVGGGS